MKRIVIFISATLLLNFSSMAFIRLPSFFSDNMVLQQKSLVNFWGWASAAQYLNIVPSWSNDTIIVRADGAAKWETVLKTPPAGGPYTISIFTPKERIELINILIGEVWFCSGQSNMVWNSLNNHQEMIDEIPNASNNNIRLLQIERIGALTPQDNIEDSWKLCTPDNIKGFSSIAYFIAKKLQKELNVPIGVINSSWGGTHVELWYPENEIKNNAFIIEKSKLIKSAVSRPHTIGSLWNSMVYPLVGYNIAGAFWYQGESNVSIWQSYCQSISTMINSWRSAWGYEFPFYFVQIAPYNYKSPGRINSAYLREQQVKTLEMPNTGMVVVTDLVPDTNDIHPAKKIGVADRLSMLALVEAYGKKLIDYKSPVYDYSKIEKNKILIHFKYLSDGLVIDGKNIKELYIAGEDKVFYPAEGKIIKKNILQASSKDVPKPVAVRFGFSDASIPNLFNTKGLPVSPFRTDNW